MKMIIGVEEFGKIKRATINVSNYTVFIGDNNSGKTLLMQLIYGVLHYIQFPADYTVKYVGEILGKYRKNEKSSVSPDDLKIICKEINEYLDNTKNEIVSAVFMKKMPIKKLYVDIEIYENELCVNHEKKTYEKEGNQPIEYEAWRVYDTNKEKANWNIKLEDDKDGRLLNMFLFAFGMGYKYRLFLPASRTGIQLLYKDFYANKVEEVFLNNESKSQTGFWGMTRPVYDFLKFLQIFKPGDLDEKTNHTEIVDFIEKELLGGQLVNTGSDVSYKPDDGDKTIPLYMASSMINEIAPLLMAMSEGKWYDFLFMDEVETSLHPKKQKQLARLFTRINNGGTRLLLSTHSDTMASYLYLINLLGTKNGYTDIELESIGMDEGDIIRNSEIHFYQFEDRGNYSIVDEVETDSYGVNFKQFNESLDNLYEMSRVIVGVK